MMKGKIVVGAMTCSLALALLVVPAVAGGITLGVGGGVTSLTGDIADGMNMGFCGGAQGFFAGSPNVLLGVRVAYHRWGANNDELNALCGGVANCEVSGSLSAFEICPSVRFVAPMGEGGMSVFGHVGGGMYRMGFDVTAEVMGVSASGGDSEMDAGFNFGGGVLIPAGGFHIELFPQYHVVATEGESTKFWSATASISIPVN